MDDRKPLRAALEMLAGTALCAWAIFVGVFGSQVAYAILAEDSGCGYDYRCPSAAEEAAVAIGLELGAGVAVALLVVGGLRLLRGTPRVVRAWLLGAAGVLSSFGLAAGALAWLGSQGAFS